MADVVRLARIRRAHLVRELADLDRFVRTAEALIEAHGTSRGAPDSDSPDDRVTSRAAPEDESTEPETTSRTARKGRDGDRTDSVPPEVDPFQALFNSGEVLPPLCEDAEDWVPLDSPGAGFFRRGPERR